MLRVEIADKAQVESIYRETYPLWGYGLSWSGYFRLWDEVAGSPWAQENAQFLVSTDARGGVLSSLKQYLPRIRLFGKTDRALIIGAVFTPRIQRRHGHAAALIRAVLERGRDQGLRVAMLFSDIGTLYYEGLGFRGVPAVEHWGILPRRLHRPSGAWELRGMIPADLALMRQAHEQSHAHRPVAIVRDESHWGFVNLRSRIFCEQLKNSGLRLQTVVAQQDGRFAGYITAVEGGDEWNIREVAVPEGDPRSLMDLLFVAAEDARRRGLRRVYGWLPPETSSSRGEWRLRVAPRARAIPMLAPLDDGLELDSLYSDPGVYFPFQDQF